MCPRADGVSATVGPLSDSNRLYLQASSSSSSSRNNIRSSSYRNENSTKGRFCSSLGTSLATHLAHVHERLNMHKLSSLDVLDIILLYFVRRIVSKQVCNKERDPLPSPSQKELFLPLSSVAVLVVDGFEAVLSFAQDMQPYT